MCLLAPSDLHQQQLVPAEPPHRQCQQSRVDSDQHPGLSLYHQCAGVHARVLSGTEAEETVPLHSGQSQTEW